MNQIPSPTNWPDKNEVSARLKNKRARLIPIACGNELDAEGKLVALTRQFQRREKGRLVGFVGAFMYREKITNEIRIANSAHGRIGLDGQIMMARKLQRWIESDD